jgi:NTP pyrophosphatase (non-canonical NTP hydrolase)
MILAKKTCGKAGCSVGYGAQSQVLDSLIHTAFTADLVSVVPLTDRSSYDEPSHQFCTMRKKSGTDPAQILLFPTGEPVSTPDSADSMLEGAGHRIYLPAARPKVQEPKCEVVISGSFRRDVEGLRRTHEELSDLGCRILSPARVQPSREVDGFVYMEGEESVSAEGLELQHLNAIERATFVWLHAPDGYVGLSAALEVGFARAQGIPVYCQAEISDTTLRGFIHHVDSVADVLARLKKHELPVPAPNLRAFQSYYRRVASQRGYERENARDCLLLMVEEVGELARAVRKRERLARHGPPSRINEAHELADVFLYVVHMANVLELDLGSVVREKEEVNLAKFVRSR